MKNHFTIWKTRLQYEEPFHYYTKPLSQYKNPFDHNMKIPFTVYKYEIPIINMNNSVYINVE